MHPDASKNVTRFCNQNFWPCNQDIIGNSCQVSFRQGIISGYNLFSKSIAKSRAKYGKPLSLGFHRERLNVCRVNRVPHTSLSPQNKYPSKRNFLRGFHTRKILTYLPLPPKPAVAITSSWLRRVFSHALCPSMIRVWAFPMFSHCSPPHVR